MHWSFSDLEWYLAILLICHCVSPAKHIWRYWSLRIFVLIADYCELWYIHIWLTSSVTDFCLGKSCCYLTLQLNDTHPYRFGLQLFCEISFIQNLLCCISVEKWKLPIWTNSILVSILIFWTYKFPIIFYHVLKIRYLTNRFI